MKMVNVFIIMLSVTSLLRIIGFCTARVKKSNYTAEEFVEENINVEPEYIEFLSFQKKLKLGNLDVRRIYQC